MRRVLPFVALAVVTLLAIAGCGGTAAGATGGSGSGQTITVKMSEMKFEPSTFTVKANEPVTVNVQNVGTVTHDFSIKDLSPEFAITVEPGKTGSKTFTPTKAGTYEVYCNQPGHEPAGMKGTLTVQ